MKFGAGCMMRYKEQVCMEEVIKNMQIYHLKSKVRIRLGQFFCGFTNDFGLSSKFFFPATDDTFLINVTWNLSDIRNIFLLL